MLEPQTETTCEEVEPMAADDLPPNLETLLTGVRTGALATLKRDGRPQLSNVSFSYHPPSRTVRISTTADRAKTANLRRDPRASLYVTTPDMGAYAVAEGAAELTPVAADPHDAVVEELVEVYRLIQGEHPDWDEYRAAMVADRRLVVRLRVERVYGWGPVDAVRADD
jgi:PPOX class probable F420-dependent enzyme